MYAYLRNYIRNDIQLGSNCFAKKTLYNVVHMCGNVHSVIHQHPRHTQRHRHRHTMMQIDWKWTSNQALTGAFPWKPQHILSFLSKPSLHDCRLVILMANSILSLVFSFYGFNLSAESVMGGSFRFIVRLISTD